MSIEAIKWVLNDACWTDQLGEVHDVPPQLVAQLLSLANQADDHGKGAYPSQATMSWNTRKGERAVRKDLALALELGLIRHGDQRLVDHIPADARPVVYDLAVELCRPPRDRTRRAYRQTPGTGPVVPAPAGGSIPDSDNPQEPQNRAEPQFPPEPQGRPNSRGAGTTGPAQPDISAGTTDPAGSTDPPGTGTTVPPTRPSTQMTTSSSSSSTARERLARAVAIVRARTDAVDDDEAAALAEHVRTAYGVHPAMLGAYLRAMAESGDLQPALAELRARATGPPAAKAAAARAPTLVELHQRSAPPLRGQAAREAAARARAAIRTRTGTGTGTDPTATAATA